MTSGFPNPYEGARGRPSGAHSVATRRRSRPLLPLGVAVWAVLEIWLLTLVGQAWGGLTVFLILAGGLLVGTVLGVALFRGVPVGPLIAAGIISLFIGKS